MVQNVLAGRYRLEEQIARGGMGQVWRAHDEVLERPVAIKLLDDALASDERAAARFRREALTAASVAHPNMASVYDYVEENGRPGIVMELVPSETLAHRLARAKLSTRDAVSIADSVLAALECAHAAGVVHRDIKPGNILLTPEGTVKVTDFGIARAASDASLTQTGTVMGTAHYSAPEQIRGDLTSSRTDLYSVGVVLYEMLTGTRPYSGDTPIAVAMARLSEDPVPPSELVDGIPPALEAVVMRALSRNPADRYATAAEMRSALRAASSDEFVEPTAALSLTSTDPTLVLGGAAPAAIEQKESPLADVVPPAWAGKRLAMVLVPLVAMALIAWAIIAWASGPSTTRVPTFTGRTLAESQTLAARAHIDLHWQLASSTRARGTVLKQSVSPLTTVKTGTSVTLTVSSGPPPCCTVPDVTKMKLPDATDALARAGLRVGKTINVATTDVPAGTVISQDPTSGHLQPGDTVDLTVAQAPAPAGRHKKHHEG